MKTVFLPLSIVFWVGASALGQVAAKLLNDPVAKIEVTIRDEALSPVPNIEVIAVFPQSSDELAKYRFVKKRAATGKDGGIVFADKTILNPSIGVQLAKHYVSGREVELNVNEGGQKDGQWLPIPFIEQLILKKIIKPVPMYAVAAWPIVLPAKDGSFGFDLEKRDWVVPHGAGAKSDLIFTLEKKEDSVLGNSATLRVTFSNPSDGLIPLYELPGVESELKLPRIAPMEGYEAERKFTTNWSPTRLPAPPTRPALGYLYRVRTVLDGKGQVKSGLYGKIDGEFEWDASNFPTAQVTFTYYLNPDGTQNLEFDRKKNLFLDLADEHIVRRP